MAIAACSPVPNAPTETRSGQSTYAFENIAPFSNANSVKLFVESGEKSKGGEAVLRSASGRLLTRAERAKLDGSFQTRRVIRRGDEAESAESCFIPHHFFHYFDKMGRKIGQIDVCFCCEGVLAKSFGNTPKLAGKEGEALVADYSKLKALVSSMGEPTDIECAD